jgi:hypothetical protein
MENEEASFTLNLSLGLLFAIVCCFAASRIISLYENTTGGKVVTTFYFLIFVSALLRSILFFIPSFTTSLSVHTAQNFVYLSIIFLGNVFVYSVFHLVVAYWQNILRKIDTEEEEFRRHLFLRFTELDRKGPMSHFLDRFGLYFAVVFLNLILYLCHAYGEVILLLYDSILFLAVPSALSLEITTLSQRLRQVLLTIGVINANNTAIQAQRILAITVVANIFFTVQIVLHSFIAAFILYAWHMSNDSNEFYGEDLTSLNIDSFYWNLYTLIKYFSEVIMFSRDFPQSLHAFDVQFLNICATFHPVYYTR